MTQPPSFELIAPVFPVSQIAAAATHYRALGFQVELYDGADYAFARRGSVEIHLALVAEVDPATTTSAAFLLVGDADAVHAEWAQVEGGRDVAPSDTDYGIREGAHLDPDGNLIRYGSRR